ncbi:MAG: helix-turn-helix transcriptional regulator [Acidimicrobiales bacterium]
MVRETDPVSTVVTLAALADPLRRRVYDHVAAHPSGVSRDGAAEALGVARSVAAFHLDKLAEVGLLVVDFRRPPGRSGPGAGRPAKWYSRAEGEIAVSVPERRYSLAASLLARAVERAAVGEVGVAAALADVAREHGHEIGRALGAAGGEQPSVGQCLVELLVAHGYEPRRAGDLITLANCPFHSLAEEHRDLVCHMNHELLCGVAEEAGLPSGAARLDPAPGRCCVTLVA